MTVYVERNESGGIKGVYQNPQEGYAEEAVDDTDAEVVAFREAPAVAVELERTKQRNLVSQVDVIVADFAAYEAIPNPTAAQRKQFDDRIGKVVIAILKRMTQKD